VNGLPLPDYEAAPVNPAVRLAALASTDMAGVEALIADRASSATAVIPAIAHYLLDAGGKRQAHPPPHHCRDRAHAGL